jgi:hypothetical protein
MRANITKKLVTVFSINSILLIFNSEQKRYVFSEVFLVSDIVKIRLKFNLQSFFQKLTILSKHIFIWNYSN